MAEDVTPDLFYQKLASLRADVAALRDELRTQRDGFRENISALAARAAAIETRLDLMEPVIERVRSELVSLDRKFDLVLTILGPLLPLSVQAAPSSLSAKPDQSSQVLEGLTCPPICSALSGQVRQGDPRRAGLLHMETERFGHAQLTTTAIDANAVCEEEQSIAARMW